MSNTVRQFIVFALIVVIAGVVGGIIGNLWGKEFVIAQDDKFDIFASLLAALGVLLGIAFGGLGAITYNVLYQKLVSQTEEVTNKLEKRLTNDYNQLVRETRVLADRLMNERLVHSQAAFAEVYWQMALDAEEQRYRFQAIGLFRQSLLLNRTALESAEELLSASNESERALVLDIKNNIAMNYAWQKLQQ